MKRLLIVICVVLAGRNGIIGSEQRQSIKMKFYQGDDISDMIAFSNFQRLQPLDEPEEQLLSEPSYGSTKHYYYSARYGDAVDKIYTFVIDESGGTGTGYNVLYADLNNDNRLDPEREKMAVQVGSIDNIPPIRLKLALRAGDETVPYSFDFWAYPRKVSRDQYVEKIYALCRDTSICLGRAIFDGKECRIVVADLNCNGLFNDVEQGIFSGDRFAVDLDGNGCFKNPNGPKESFPCSRYTKIADKWYAIETSPGGMHVQIDPASPPLGRLKTEKHVVEVHLYSSTQTQYLTLLDGSAEAVAGTYKLAYVALEAKDEQGHVWRTFGRSMGCSQREVTIQADTVTSLPNILPLTVCIDTAETSSDDVVTLIPRITTTMGCFFNALSMDQKRVPASFQILSDQDDIVDSGQFEYG